MADLSADGDDRDGTHFWVFCPGCAYTGKIGVPHNHPADVVVCPKCREVVNVRPQDRVCWRPTDADEFLRRRFPSIDWDNIEREPRPARPAAKPPAIEIRERAAPRAGARSEGRSNRTAALWLAAGWAALMLATLIIVVGQGTRHGGHVERVAVAERGPDIAAAHEPPAPVNPTPQFPPKPPAQPPVPPPPQAPPLPPPPVPKAPPPPAWQELFDRACQRLRGGDYAAAVDDLNEVLRLNPGFAEALGPRTTAYYRLGRLERALADANEEVRLYPANYQALVARSVVHEALGDWPQAVADLEGALKLAMADAGDDGSKAEIRQLQEDFTTIVHDLDLHAQAHYRRGRYEQAIPEFSTLMRYRPGAALPVLWRAASYQALGAHDQALADYNRGLAMSSAPAWGYAARSKVHEQNRRYAAAVRDMHKAVELTPTNRNYHERLKQLEQFDVHRRFQPQPFPPRPRKRTRA